MVSMPKISTGFHSALQDVQPDRAFVVHSGEDRYPLSGDVEAIGLLEILKLLKD